MNLVSHLDESHHFCKFIPKFSMIIEIYQDKQIPLYFYLLKNYPERYSL
ncbi:hypothetical protein LEP1GSC116_0249, partial [Leptospira interrogans serovar Icterohaemorrhagiae str. Verdun HP]